MSADYANSRLPDITGAHSKRGAGVVTTWRCLGCGLGRPLLGSRGAGVRKRCSVCIETARLTRAPA